MKKKKKKFLKDIQKVIFSFFFNITNIDLQQKEGDVTNMLIRNLQSSIATLFYWASKSRLSWTCLLLLLLRCVVLLGFKWVRTMIIPESLSVLILLTIGGDRYGLNDAIFFSFFICSLLYIFVNLLLSIKGYLELRFSKKQKWSLCLTHLLAIYFLWSSCGNRFVWRSSISVPKPE